MAVVPYLTCPALAAPKHPTSQPTISAFVPQTPFLGKKLCSSFPIRSCLVVRRGSSPAPVKAFVKEQLGRVTKSWSDLSALNYWVVKDYYRLVNSVNSLEPKIQKLSDEQLASKTVEFRSRLQSGETLADIQAEAFAVVREAAKRKLGMRHFDVQIIGGAVLHDGSIAEMKTGEGKTLVSTLAAYLNALTGDGVHVVAVNDYLAKRDADWMGLVHRFPGLSVGLIQRGMTATERRSNDRCDITYTNNSELGLITSEIALLPVVNRRNLFALSLLLFALLFMNYRRNLPELSHSSFWIEQGRS